MVKSTSGLAIKIPPRNSNGPIEIPDVLVQTSKKTQHP